MEPSPLTRDERPATFQPKIAQLYEDLFQPDDQLTIEPDGFWREFFLLKTDKARLWQRLESLSTTDLLQLQHESQQLFAQALAQIKYGLGPMDENALDVGLNPARFSVFGRLTYQTLVVYLSVVLAKKYTNPSADIITVIGGLEKADSVIVEFVTVIERSIRIGRTSEYLSFD